MGVHLDEPTLRAYAQSKLDEDSRAEVERHADDCTKCKRALTMYLGRSSTPFAAEVTLPARIDSGAADDPWMPTAGARIAGRYTIVKQLGRGGMGHVFQATDHELGIEVALKVLRPELTMSEEQIRHLRREILASRKISHPNVCRVFDLGRDERLYFITMELVGGTTLGDMLKGGSVPPQLALHVLRQLVSALAAAHAEGIVHRDLKPANVMVDAASKVKVMDFGLARDLGGDHSLSGHVGTPAYWSPEQSRGESAGPPADLYALGLIAYQMLTGDATFRQVRQWNFDAVPQAFRSWIRRCLRADPTERFVDAGAAAVALEDISVGALGPVSRRWIGAAASLAVVAVLVGAGVWATASRGSTSNRGEAATTPPEPTSAPSLDAAVPVAVDASLQADAHAIDAPTPVDAAVRRVRVDPPGRPRNPLASPVDAGPSTRADASLLYEP